MKIEIEIFENEDADLSQLSQLAGMSREETAAQLLAFAIRFMMNQKTTFGT